MIIRTSLLLSTVIAGAIGLAACSESPSCGSQAVQNVVESIAKEHPEVTFKQQTGIIGLIIGQAAQRPGIGLQAIASSSRVRSLNDRKNALETEICGPLERGTMQMRCQSGLSPELVKDTRYIELKNEIDGLMAQARESVTYSLDTIRMVSRNPDTNAVACVANITARFEDGAASKEINYTAEPTTDDKLHVSVSGL